MMPWAFVYKFCADVFLLRYTYWVKLLGLMITLLSTMSFIFWFIILEHKLHITGFFVGLFENLFLSGCAGLLLGCSSLQCWDVSLCRRLCGARAPGCASFKNLSARAQEQSAVACGLSCSATRRIVPDQGSNPRLLHLQADSLPLSHPGSLWWLNC